MSGAPSTASDASRNRGLCSVAPAMLCGGSCRPTRQPAHRALGVTSSPSMRSHGARPNGMTNKHRTSRSVSRFFFGSRICVRHPWQGSSGLRISVAAVLCLGMSCSSPQASQPNQTTPASSVKSGPTMPTPGPPFPALTAVFEYLGPDITPPRLVNNIQPQFPEELRGIKVTPRPFIYTIVVDQEGNVRNLKPTRVPAPTPPYDALDRCFREAILQWRYRPAEKAGRPVAVQLTVSANVEVR